MIKVGLAGIGRWGKNILRNLDQLSEVRVCCHTGTASRRNFVRKKYPHMDLTTDYNRILDDPEINAVAIATPIDTHYELASKALRAGKDVFVEKPMAGNRQEAMDLREQAEQSEHILFVGYIYVHHPVFPRIESIHRETPIRRMSVTLQKTGGFSEPLLENLTCHDLAIGRALFDTSPEFTVDHVYRTGERIDLLEGTARYDGTLFQITTNRIHPDKDRFLHFETEEDFWLWKDEDLYRFQPEANQFEIAFQSDEEPLCRELHTFLTCVQEGTPPRTGATFGAAVNQDISALNDAI